LFVLNEKCICLRCTNKWDATQTRV